MGDEDIILSTKYWTCEAR